ncbi:hypothetical protein DFJ63DRAFT_315499 [Scheffersomyces coipomensis]|uniref:uncharacterized protein n=1 Tax=Scheffersomyces coipomensis TaxID=1788519 RepID=UPI00315C5371
MSVTTTNASITGTGTSTTSGSTTTNMIKSRSNSIDINKLLISSYLYKKSLKSNQWKRYWVVLRKLQLNYYNDSSEHKPKRVYNIKFIKFISILKYQNDETSSELYQFLIYTNDKILHFKAKDKSEYNDWIKNLKILFDHDQSYNFPIEYISEDNLNNHNHNHNNHNHAGGDTPDDSSNEDLPFQSHHSSELTANDKLQQLSNQKHHTNDDDNNDEYLVQTGDLKLSNQYHHHHHRLNLLKWKKVKIILTNKFAYIYKLNHLNLLLKLNLNDILEVLELEPKTTHHHHHQSSSDLERIFKLLIITSNNHYLFRIKYENDLLNWLSCFKTLVNARRSSSSTSV